jgi:hypothetical protein
VALPALALAVSLCLPGCGGGSGKTVGHVAGKVTFKGNPVREGRVSFQSPSGEGDEALLKEDGTFTINALPVGEYKITVTPLIVRQQVDGKGPEVGVERPAPDIPEKYRTVGTTALKATVKEGTNEFPFDLNP